MLRRVVSVGLLGLLAACGGQADQFGPTVMAAGSATSADMAEPAVELIAAEDLALLVARGEVVLIDVRTPGEFGEGRLPGALNAPVETFDAASIPIEAERETILYCRSARRSQQAAEMLAEHTGGTVRHLEGGITAWQAMDGEIVGAPES